MTLGYMAGDVIFILELFLAFGCRSLLLIQAVVGLNYNLWTKLEALSVERESFCLYSRPAYNLPLVVKCVFVGEGGRSCYFHV